MDDKYLWTTFEETGSVMDYLIYKGIHAELERNKKGENAVESVDHSDRDDTIRDTDW